MAFKPYSQKTMYPELDALMKETNPNQIVRGNPTGAGSGNPLQQTAPSFFIDGNTNNFSGGFDVANAGFDTSFNNLGNMGIGSFYDPTQGGGNGGGNGTGGDPEDDPDNGDEGDGGTTTAYPGQDPLEILKSYFPDADIEQLEKLTKFVSVIPSEIYEAADPGAEMYSLMRQERTGQLEEQRGLSEDILRDSLFRSLEEARGMSGKRGFALGRNIYGDVSQAAAQRFEGVQSDFSRGLYNINEEIINRITTAQKYLAGLESQQKTDLLKLADLADLFSLTDDEGGEPVGDDEQGDAEEQGRYPISPGFTLPDIRKERILR